MMSRQISRIDRLFVGIDPGRNGAIATVDGFGILVGLMDMPTATEVVAKKTRKRVHVSELVAALSPYVPMVTVAAIEDVGGITGQAASASFAFGRMCGLVEGALIALGMPVCRVRAQRWHKVVGLPTRATKDDCRALAAANFPERAASFARKKDDGRADAAMIAHWARRAFQRGF